MKKTPVMFLVFLAASLGLGAAQPGRFGMVGIQGKNPKPAHKPVHLDREACGKVHTDDTLVVGSKGGLANVVVTWGGVEPSTQRRGDIEAQRKSLTQDPVTLVQRGCAYVPHITVLRPGQPLIIINADPALHTTGFKAKRNRVKTAAQPRGSEPLTVIFGQPEAIRLYCDVHDFMEGWVYVTDAMGFAVTGKDGKFSVDGIPEGTQLNFWHEKLGVAGATLGKDPWVVRFPVSPPQENP